MHVVQRRQRVQKKMNGVLERGVVSNVRVGSIGERYGYSSLGEVDGLFNLGKMFTRMFTFKPKSFSLANISASIGSATLAIGSGGLLAFSPKTLSAHGSAARVTGALVVGGGIAPSIAPKAFGLSKGEANIVRGITAAAAAVAGGIMLAPMMAGGTALTAAGTTAGTTAGTVAGTAAKTAAAGAGGGFFSTLGGGLLSLGKAILPTALMSFMGGGKPQPSGMTQAEYDAQMAQQAAVQAQQAAVQAQYEADVRAQQQQMYQPGTMPVAYDYNTGYLAQPASMNTSYGDLRSPYTAISEEGQTVQIDPNTGQVIQPGLSTQTYVIISGVVLLAGWYLMSGNDQKN